MDTCKDTHTHTKQNKPRHAM